MKQLQAVILDLDGVLVDSERTTFEIWHELLKSEYQIELEPWHYMNYTGTDSQMFEKGISYHFPQVDLTGLLTLWLDEFEKRALNGEITEKLGLQRLLAVTEKHRLKRAIATANSQTKWLSICRKQLNAEKWFPVMVTGNDVDQHKPDPEVYLKAAKSLQVDPEKCLAVEDSAIGIEAALNAGMKVVRIRDIAPVSIEYEKKCIASFDSLEDVAELIEKMEEENV